SGQYLNPENIWKDALNKSGYNKAISFDFGYQISSIFTLNSVNTDLQNVLKMLTALNQPVDLTFTNYDLDNISNITYSYTSTNNLTLNVNFYLNSNGASSLNNIGSDAQNSFNGKVSYSNDDISKINQEVTSNINGSQIQYWTDAWTKYKTSSTTTSSNTTTASSGSDFVSNFFAQNRLSTNSENTENLIKQINTIQYSAFISLVHNGIPMITTTQSDGSKQQTISDEGRVQLELLGIDLSNVQHSLQSSIIFNYTIPNTTTSTRLTLSNPFSLFPKDIMDKAKIVNVEPVLQSKVIIPVWVSVSIIIFLLAIILYFRRDFA
ncbi:MAG: hypothetical protein HDR31_01115, partial [Mycoplasma sp.]|nr:hypothetical protein [Mycoplasma sp.]